MISIKDDPEALNWLNEATGEGDRDLADADLPEWEATYLAMYDHALWHDDTDRALAGFSESGIPEMVQERMREAILGGAIFSDFDEIPSNKLQELRTTLADTLTEDGWTIDELSDAIENVQPGLEEYEYERIARSETQEIVAEAREDAYVDRGLEDAAFRWTGPSDHRTTEVCEWIKEQTADGVSLERLKELIQEGNDRFDISTDAREFQPHIQCRHTYVRHVE